MNVNNVFKKSGLSEFYNVINMQVPSSNKINSKFDDQILRVKNRLTFINVPRLRLRALPGVPGGVG